MRRRFRFAAAMAVAVTVRLLLGHALAEYLRVMGEFWIAGRQKQQTFPP